MVTTTKMRVHVMLALVLLCAAVCSASSSSSTSFLTEVTLPNGAMLTGTEEITPYGAAGVFTGIRYGVAPVGELRWKPPVAYSYAANESVDATSPPPVCMQTESTMPPSSSSTLPSEPTEDCLFLNVWSPAVGASQLKPVMAWVHGGWFNSGYSDLEYYNGANISTYADVVVVSFNYRLGPFGFLGHDALYAESGTTGNYGMLDQIAALEWIRDNIASFGGDPTRVTLFGEAAGGVSVLAQAASPRADALFIAGISQSGDSYAAISLSAATDQGGVFASAAGCSGSSVELLECMRNLSATTVLNTLSPAVTGFSQGAVYRPVVDGFFLTQTPQAAFNSGGYAPRPFVVGSNNNGASVFVMFNTTAREMSSTAFEKTVSNYFFPIGGQDLVDNITTLYPLSDYSGYPYPPAEAYSAILTDYLFTCPALSAAQSLAETTNYVFLYNFSYVPECTVFPGPVNEYLGSYNFAEVPYIFNNAPPSCAFSAAEEKFATSLQDYWGYFAITTTVNSYYESGPDWVPVTPYTYENLNIGSTIGRSSSYNKEKCNFWIEFLDSMPASESWRRAQLMEAMVKDPVSLM